jgi:hypothetical protein
MKWISIFLLLLCHSRYKFFFHQRNQHKSDETTFIKWNFFLSHSTWAAIIVIIFIFCAFFSEMILNYIFFVCSDFWFFFILIFLRSFAHFRPTTMMKKKSWMCNMKNAFELGHHSASLKRHFVVSLLLLLFSQQI